MGNELSPAEAEQKWLADNAILTDNMTCQEMQRFEELLAQQTKDPISCPRCQSKIDMVTGFHYKDYRGKCSLCQKICVWRQSRDIKTVDDPDRMAS